MKQRIIKAMQSTWDAIAGDVLAITDENGEFAMASREAVAEMVCDADRLRMYGDDSEAAEAFYALEWRSKERQELILAAFPDEEYC